MGTFGKAALAAATVAITLTTAWASEKDPWWGRHTHTAESARALGYAFEDPGVRGIAMNRYAAGNILVDHGASDPVAVAGGFEVEVYFNYEPAGGAPLGDLSVIVGLDPAGEPTGIVSISDPTPVDDTELPGAGDYQEAMTAHQAVGVSLVYPQVSDAMEARFAAGRELRDSQTVLLSSDSKWARYAVTFVIRNADGSPPPPGEGDIVVEIKVKHDLSRTRIASVTEY